jgi:RHS repeat-associated protein
VRPSRPVSRRRVLSQYGWNAYGQLSSYSTPVPKTTTFTYNGLGLRMSETPPTGTPLSFTWDTVTGGATPLLTSDGVNSYVYGPLLFGGIAPIEQIVNATSTPEFLTVEPMGVQFVFGHTATVLEQANYSTYGTQTMQSGTAVSPISFEGSYSDVSTLNYMINRYVDLGTDQFISVDPLVAETGQPFAFTNDDPLNETDPLGLIGKGWYCINGKSHYYNGNKQPGFPTGKCVTSSKGTTVASCRHIVACEDHLSVEGIEAAQRLKAPPGTPSLGSVLGSVFDHINPAAVLRCFDAVGETVGAYGVSTVVTVGSVFGEGATLGTSTIGVLSGIAMYGGSTAIGYVAYQECSDAF